MFDLTKSWGLGLSYHIIYQPGKLPASWTSDGIGTFDASYLITNDKTGLPQNNPSIVTGTPVQFVDAAQGDYHLAPVSQKSSISVLTTPATTLMAAVSQVDLPIQANLYGTTDLGAYERQNLFRNCGKQDSLFCDGFED